MRRLVLSFILVVATLFLLVPTQSVKALPDQEIYYTVIYSCHVGPPPDWYGTVVGEWTRMCNGSLIGWGMKPFGESCVDTIVELGESCGNENQP
jgi:hypothetical protein